MQRTFNMWLRYLAFGTIVCVCSCTEEHANLVANPDKNLDILEELRVLRKMVVENRILITKQETELKTVKRELEETKRNYHCGSTSDEKKTTAKKVEVPQKKATLIRRGKFPCSVFFLNSALIQTIECMYMHYTLHIPPIQTCKHHSYQD